MFEGLSIIQMIAVACIPLLFAITIHEAAHGFIAHKLGDDTAHKLGRITANPIKHIDLVGTIILPLIFIALKAPIIFGWAKPVPVNTLKLRNPKRDMGLVAAAGPISNFIMAIVWAGVLRFVDLNGADFPGAVALYYMSQYGIIINVVLMVLNFLPIPPLDGSQVLASLLPPNVAARFLRIGQLGFIIIIALAFSGLLGKVMLPFIGFFWELILSMWGLL